MNDRVGISFSAPRFRRLREFYHPILLQSHLIDASERAVSYLDNESVPSKIRKIMYEKSRLDDSVQLTTSSQEGIASSLDFTDLPMHYGKFRRD